MWAKKHGYKTKMPENFSYKDLMEHPEQHKYTDEAHDLHRKKHRAIADKLNDEIINETPHIIKVVESMKGYHEDAVRDADDLIKELKNKNRETGNHLPTEYMDLEHTEIGNFIRDWSNVSYSGMETHGSQNQAILKDLKDLRAFENKLAKFHDSHSEVS